MNYFPTLLTRIEQNMKLNQSKSKAQNTVYLVKSKTKKMSFLTEQADSIDRDQTAHPVQSDLDLYCLQK